MAQYFPVLSSNDNVKELAQFYPDNENHTVQYLITSNTPSNHFQTQQVVVGADQLVVLDNNIQKVILDQSSVAYQTPYIIQKAPNTPQPIYYMTNTQQPTQLVVDQVITPQQVIVNPQIIPTTTLTKIISQPSQIQQSIGPKQIITTNNNQIMNNIQEHESDPIENILSEIVTLADGTVLTLAQYKKLLHQQQQQQQQQQEQNLQLQQQQQQQQLEQQQQHLKLNERYEYSGLVGGMQQNLKKSKGGLKTKLSMDHQNEDIEEHLSEQIPVENNLFQVGNQQINDSYIIKPPSKIQNKLTPLPEILQSPKIQSLIANIPKNEEYSDSIRMLVMLENGEQRLITFTLPKETCTIHEILEQVSVEFNKDTKIQVIETNSYGINYIVTVGNVSGMKFNRPNDMDNTPNNSNATATKTSSDDDNYQLSIFDGPSDNTRTQSSSSTSVGQSKFIPGKLAVCSHCGYLSEDFNRCSRCKFKFPDNVKALTNTTSPFHKNLNIPKLNLLQKKRHNITINKNKLTGDCETVVVSSDDEDEKKNHSKLETTPIQSPSTVGTSLAALRSKQMNDKIIEKLGGAITISPISKEPTINEIRKFSLSNVLQREHSKDLPFFSTLIDCRTVRIGSYRYIPPDMIKIDTTGLHLKVPLPKQENTIKLIKIDSSDIYKILICYSKSLPVIFYYLTINVGTIVRRELDMAHGTEHYFDPLSDMEESHKRLTLLPEILTEESKHILTKIYPKHKIDELTYKEANDILIKTCPKELTRTHLGMGEIKKLLVYPPEGKGRITINTEDYMCLGQEQFLNDVIIDFYITYLYNNLPKNKSNKVHIFSTFFYKRLTTKPTKATRKSQPTEIDPNLTAAEKRHARVKTWTKNVNIFEKDFIIVPINENCHWFLAIICYPGLDGSITFNDEPIKIEEIKPKPKKKPVEKKTTEQLETPVLCEDEESDKDEAEGDESELESDESDEVLPSSNPTRPPIKQSCIIIFDSLSGANRSKVVATLRDYLTCEYKTKMHKEKIFNKDIIKGTCPRIPQQNNFTDCGLYVLQYVEQFFKEPIKDYYIPIKHLQNWFDESVVTKKREEIALLIQSLMKEFNNDLSFVPDINFPSNSDKTENNFPDEEDEVDDEKETNDNDDENDEVKNIDSDDFKTSHNDDYNEQSQNSNDDKEFNKSDSSDLILNTTTVSKTSNRDTLSYLKAKRIIRHKKSEQPEVKKIKNY